MAIHPDAAAADIIYQPVGWPSSADTTMAIDLCTERPTASVNDQCGPIITTAAGKDQRHEIPGDDAPHAPTDECGCGPQRYTAGSHLVHAHVDQDLY